VAQAALNWIANRPGVGSVTVGAATGRPTYRRFTGRGSKSESPLLASPTIEIRPLFGPAAETHALAQSVLSNAIAGFIPMQPPAPTKTRHLGNPLIS
jgi:hypothetical protein